MSKNETFDDLVIEYSVPEKSEYWGSDCGEQESLAVATYHARRMAERLGEMYPGASINCTTSPHGRPATAYDESGERSDIAEIVDALDEKHRVIDAESLPDNRAIVNYSCIRGQFPTDELLNRFDWTYYCPEIDPETCRIVDILAGDGIDIDDTCGVYASPDSSGHWRITGLAPDDEATDLRANRGELARIGLIVA